MSSGAWRTRFGFYMAAFSSAFGLGNVWRFPYVVAENGGGAFVLLYIFLAFFIGMPLLIGELMLGKNTQKSLILALEQVGDQDRSSCWRSWLGRGAVALAGLVLAYFSVISGWVLYFLSQFSVDLLSGGVVSDQSLNVLMQNGWLQVMLASVHILIVIIIVAKEVEEGMEKWVGVMMPVFVVVLLVLASKSLSLPETSGALRYFFYPDFSKLTINSLSYALGHVLFTLTLGFGTMVTFGSYLRQKVHIPTAGFRVATMDSFISLFAGLLIFPLVVTGAFGAVGPELLFATVPGHLGAMKGGGLFGALFFLCLYLVSLGASISLLETIVSNMRNKHGIRRTHAAWVAGLVCFIFAIFPGLSSTVFARWSVEGRSLIELIDVVLINWFLPISALGISQVVCYRLKNEIKKQEFKAEEGPMDPVKLYSHWLFALKWVVPGLVLLSLGLQVVSLLS